MMYKHVIDECLDRAREEYKIYRHNGRHEDADHVMRQIRSLKRLRRKAPEACFNAESYRAADENKSLAQILMEFRPY